MKYSNARGSAARLDRVSQLRRDQEAAPRLRATYPSVEQLRFDLFFEGGGARTPVPQAHVMHPPARAYFSFPCPCADCDGWFDLAAAAQATVDGPTHRIEGVLACTGSRGSESASKTPCRLRLRYTLTAVCSPAH